MSLTRTVLEVPPSGLTATPVSSSQINLTWTLNPRASEYRLYRNGVLLTTLAGSSYPDTGLAQSTSYSYALSSIASTGEGPKSSSVSATTQGTTQDTQAPSIPAASVATLSISSLGVSWTASTDNFPGAITYELQRLSGSTWTTLVTQTGLSYPDSGLANATSYSYRVRARDAAGNWSAYSATVSGITGVAGDYWSSANTWPGGVVPVAGQDVTIPEGRTIILDVVTPSLGSLDIDGTLKVLHSTGTYGLTVTKCHLMGTLQIGNSESDRFPGQFTMTFTGPNTGDSHDRGMMLHHNARLLVYGRAPTRWTKLDQHVIPGDTTLTLRNAVDWRAGDEIVVGPTDWYVLGETERRTLASVSGSSVTVTSGMSRSKWGRIIYATDTGPSLTPGTFTLPDPDHPTQADFCAPVGNITRDVVFQGADDSLWSDSRFGGHIMVMDLECEVYMDGYALNRMGQAGITGRYPFHWHLPSWTKDGIFATMPYLGAYATGKAVLRNGVVRDSGNRGIVVHGADGVLLERNIVYDVRGHGIFLEDATERFNTFRENLVLRVRAPDPSQLLMQHEKNNTGGDEKGSSGFWITNLRNDFIGNHACDCNGAAFWNSIPTGPLNLSGPAPLGTGGSVVMYPDHEQMGLWEDNTGHSVMGGGELLRNSVIDSLGNTTINSFYEPTTDGLPGNFDDGRAIFDNLFVRNTFFKCGRGGHLNRVSHVKYIGGVTADNYGSDFAGSTASWRPLESVVRACWMMGYSLNNATEDKPPPYSYDHEDMPRAGGATYHFTLFFQNITFMNFRTIIQASSYPGEINGGGALKADDFYTNAIEYGNVFNTGNRYINAFPGHRDIPPNLAGTMATYNRHFTFAGALWDPLGIHGPSGRYWCFDEPFFTHGQASIHYVEPTDPGNGVSLIGPFYGFQSYVLDGVGGSSNRAAMLATRVDPDTDATIDTCEVTRSPNNGILSNMRHFSPVKDGVYKLTFPGETLPSTFQARVEGVKDATDTFTVAIHMNASFSPTSVRYMTRNTSATGTARRDCTLAASIAAVKAGDGSLYFYDTATDLLWVKFTGGLTWAGTAPTSDDLNFYSWPMPFLIS